MVQITFVYSLLHVDSVSFWEHALINAKQNRNRFPQGAINKPTSTEKNYRTTSFKNIFIIFYQLLRGLRTYCDYYILNISLLSIRMHTDGLAFQLNSVIYKKNVI